MRTNYFAAAAVLGAVGVAAAVVHSFNSFSADPATFSSDAWQRRRADVEASADPGCVLGPLVQGLLRTGQLNHRPEQYVVEQLGPPSNKRGSELIYAIGQCHGWGWHSSELVVQLSEARTVVAVTPRRVAQ